MSEAERKRRSDYKKNRSKWIMIQTIAIATLTLLLIASLLTFNQLNKAFYIDYVEQGSVDYTVTLKENEFYEDSVMGSGQSYVASLIDKLDAKFRYQLNMASDKVEYEYSYRIDARLEVVDKDSGAKIFAPTYTLKDEQSFRSRGSQLFIHEAVAIDYNFFNDLAKKFNGAYDLGNTTNTLIVSMPVEVTGSSDDFETNAENDYVISLRIPLTSKTVNVNMTASVPSGESKVLACRNNGMLDVFRISSIVLGSLDGVAIVMIIAFIYLTRNEDINYSIKVKRLLSSYRSYIQQITNELDTAGYQPLFVSTFNEMLGIRDTIQSPILMYENEDKTKTSFMIPTNTKILYVFEVKVEDYDRLYKIEQIAQDEPKIIADDVDDEALAEALGSADIELDDIEYDELDEIRTDDGVEVVSVVWPEHEHKNKVYRYDPSGETLERGDIVLVPSHNKENNRDIIRKAAVAEGNHRVAPDSLHHPLKKIIGVIRRKAEQLLTPND